MVARRFTVLALLLNFTAALAGTYDASPQNISIIRQNYVQVTQLAAKGQLLQVKRDFGCLGVSDSLRVLSKDRSGQVRKYTMQGGTDDSSVTISHYFGPDGRLSFALIEAGAVNGTQQEWRLYYGPAGNLLKLEEKTVHGPGYPFGPLWQQVVQFPEAAFDAPSPCP
ncbi:hypothetical protein MF271_02810 [Deinococcus sp. KNUC1210]|uniref:hypothetical protein n=1 Tax=Deinococcus sp. KNUC1210 TaxID=2917691 RepID=UPI001EF0F5E8|nr:hypothetical protein [Deinococcus sp. KNUC1210]ULH15593.1 hypothetical protein MF271_02810 [Deinococcus sp. KNUC1210]